MRRLVEFVVLLSLAGNAGRALAAHPLVHCDFEQNEGGWIAFGPDSAHVRITHEQAQVKAGKGALEFDFEASASKPAAAIFPVRDSIRDMKSLGFWLMADSATAAAVSLSENGGGRYVALLWLEPNKWQRVELTPEDFILADLPGDPKDPDGKLDLDQIQAIGVLDVSQIINAKVGGPERVAVVTHTGSRKLFLDDFEVSAERPAWFHARGPYEIDSFNHPQLNWFSLGGPEMNVDATQTVIKGNALEAAYEQMEDAFVLISRMLPPADFTGATHLTFDIASEADANVLFVLETKAGVRFQADVALKGGNVAEHREVALSGFALEENNHSDGKLDLSKLKSISMLDITGAYTGEIAANVVHIGNLAMVKHAGPIKAEAAKR